MTTRLYRLMVYGTMLTGMRNHKRLGGAKPIASTRTRHQFTMLAYQGVTGEFPIALPLPGVPIHGEVYVIDRATLARVDRAEVLYTREVVELDDGSVAFMYVGRISQSVADNLPVVSSGCWRSHVAGRRRRNRSGRVRSKGRRVSRQLPLEFGW